MNDSALREFCIWAREELRSQVAQRLQLYGITAQGYGDASTDVIGVRVLTEDEARQRKELIDKFLSGSEEGYEQRYEALVERAAYTWFNRLAAIRYMEVNGLLPSGVRMLSASDGSFAPQVLRMAGDVDIAGVDRMQVARLVADGDDEKLFRYLLLAQCAELADAMPDVFEPIGSAMELLLPDGLLRSGSVVERLVTAIPESDWKEGVEIVGWMYQYYNAQRKDEVFASFKKGKKAEVDAIAPATQLFTPHWIVRYLVENSLGRLWMRSHPDSNLVDSMPYYIPDEDDTVISTEAPTCHFERSEAESRNLPLTPESITVLDPACGSGHILTYCFDLLMKIYTEAGYTARDAVQSVLENNLFGIEIDPRAAELASFALAMKACEYDPRYLSRGTRTVPRVTCLVPVQVEQQELDASMPYLADRAKLLDAMEHINECGSLFVPSSEDLAALDRASEELNRRLASGDLLAYALNTAVGQMKANCEPLARTYDVVVANPPYMGSSNMDKWLTDWTKRNYPDSKRDLCTCFIERGFTLANLHGYSAMVTMESWMFLGSYEKLRERILKEKSIAALVYMNHMVMRIAFNTNATVFRNSASGVPGVFTKVEYQDLDESNKPREFPVSRHEIYRRDASSFSAIPGTPIAYWASESVSNAFAEGKRLSDYARPLQGMATGDNDRFLRLWWEIVFCEMSDNSISESNFVDSGFKYVPHNKGGEFRRWYGNIEYILRYSKECISSLSKMGNHLPSRSEYFKHGLSYSDLTSGFFAARDTEARVTFDTTGPMLFPEPHAKPYLLALMNTSIFQTLCNLRCRGLHYSNGVLATMPILDDRDYHQQIEELVSECCASSKTDWDSFETSWDFKRHPMVGD